MIALTISDFAMLTPRQQHAMLLAILVRTALEDFQVANLSNPQMKQLNQITRYALYQGVGLLRSMEGPNAEANVRYLIASIPDYWEIPGRDPDPSAVPS